jgi:hypothetical protein
MENVTMRRHYAQTKAQRQAEWLARFSDALLARRPELSGRIEWPAALHYYFSGTDVTDAVDQYCIARNIEWT